MLLKLDQFTSRETCRGNNVFLTSSQKEINVVVFIIIYYKLFYIDLYVMIFM